MATNFQNFSRSYPHVVIEDSISPSWHQLLTKVFNERERELTKLNHFLGEEKKLITVNPKGDEIWAFTRCCTPEEVKVVIMGQDPYFSKNLRSGCLGFSVGRHIEIEDMPPSLENILAEVSRDIMNSRYADTLRGYPPTHGCLEQWASQGVLLLDTRLTVRLGSAGSHANQGWEEIVGSILVELQNIHKQNGGLVFMLWGFSAREEMFKYIDRTTNKILLAGHPSPNNENDSFRGCAHFSQANDFLTATNREPIDWSL